IARDDGNIQPYKRTDVAVGLAIGAENLDDLPGRSNARRHLTYARILAARISVDRLEQLHLCLECRRTQRIVIGIEFAVSGARWVPVSAPLSPFYPRNRPRPAPHP